MTLFAPDGTPEKILIVGAGAVATAIAKTLTLEWPELDLAKQVVVVAKDGNFGELYKLGIPFQQIELTPDNLYQTLTEYKGVTILLNLAVEVSSFLLVTYCRAKNILYLDTCVEPTAGSYGKEGYSNAELRNAILDMNSTFKEHPTAVIAHGANPGLISHFVKWALGVVAHQKSIPTGILLEEGYAGVAKYLGLVAIQLAENDTQDLLSNQPSNIHEELEKGTLFVNSWSGPGFIAEGWQQPIEIALGTYDKALMAMENWEELKDGVYSIKGRKGFTTYADSWCPTATPVAKDEYATYAGMVIPHHEVASIHNFLKTADYSPTVYYVYKPSAAASKSTQTITKVGGWMPTDYLVPDQAYSGHDTLGVRLIFKEGPALWVGVQTSVDSGSSLPIGNATMLQVVGGIYGAMHWMRKNRWMGIVEAEDLPTNEVITIASTYMGVLHNYWHDVCAEHVGIGAFFHKHHLSGV
jgi:homospermidine synthase